MANSMIYFDNKEFIPIKMDIVKEPVEQSDWNDIVKDSKYKVTIYLRQWEFRLFSKYFDKLDIIKLQRIVKYLTRKQRQKKILELDISFKDFNEVKNYKLLNPFKDITTKPVFIDSIKFQVTNFSIINFLEMMDNSAQFVIECQVNERDI